MKRFLSAVLIAMVLGACSTGKVIETFEDGIDAWMIEGDAFSVSSNMDLSGFMGEKYLRSSSDDSVTGYALSPEFKVEGQYLNMLVSGAKPAFGRAAFTIAVIVDGEEVLSGTSVAMKPDSLEWVSFDLSEYQGKMAQIRLNAGQSASYPGRSMPRGVMGVDQIQMGEERLSTYLSEYTVKLHADKKYLLIPASDSGTGSRLSVEVDGENILGISQSVKTAVDEIGYYIPVDISEYSGKEVTVKLTGIRTTDAVYEAVTTSDETMNAYDEPYRPLVHFSPSFGWTNDPNGMVRTPSGEWHLALQYNPYGISHGNMHWGLAVSRDLIHWDHVPTIIAPDALGSIFSGSAVVDKQNTAGFGKDAIVAIYTSAGSMQRQSIAYSLDGGYTFTKYEGNPVLADETQRNFRDPKVSWVGDHWVMALAVGQVIRFYGSKDLKEWSLLSEFGTGIGSHAGVWECPDLLCLDYQGVKKWVLLVSINPGGPNGGSITQYFIGDFDGSRFKADPLPYPLWVDEGVDNYAGVTFSNTDGRTVFMGWMSNWSYTGKTPTQRFRNAMTLPRDLSIKHNGSHLVLASTPSEEVYASRASERKIGGVSSSDHMSIAPILEENKGAYEIDLTVAPDEKGYFSLTLSNAKGEKAVIGFDLLGKQLTFDRSQSGNISFSDAFAKEPVKVALNIRNEYKLQLFVDKGSTELFIGDGDMVFTNCVFPTEILNRFDVDAQGCKVNVKDVAVYELK